MSRTLSLLRPVTSSTLVLALVLGSVFTGLFSATTELSFASHSQCSDGKDNDDDKNIDYPQDDDCQSLDDDYEGLGLNGNFITVRDGKNSIQPGGSLVYVITLKQQRETSRLMNVDLHVPNQTSIVSASDGGSVVHDGVIHWSNVSVYKNVTRTLTVHVNVSHDAKTGEYLVARVLVDGTEDTDTTLVENYVAPASDQYRVSITDGKEFSAPGEKLTYTIRVRNVSSQNLTSDVRVAMPFSSNFLSGSPGAVRDSYNVTWKKETFSPGEEKVFTFTTLIDHDTPERYSVRSRAYVGTVSDLDETIITNGLPYDSISASITDNRNTAEVGQILTYVVTVKNDATQAAPHVNVDAGVPVYGEFVSATEGGIYDGTNIRWLLTEVAPHDVRKLSFSIRVRSDAPINSILMASAVADGQTGHRVQDQTKVVLESTEVSIAQKSVLFRKTADRSEAVPGGVINYTLSITNTLDSVISDATILDRFDARYLSLQSYQNGQYLIGNSDGRMEWKVPVLKPGESWKTTYVLTVAKDAPTGLPLDNVASLRGADVSGISLSERVSTNTSGVFNGFPETGAGMDGLLAIVLAGMALATAGMQRRFGIALI